MIAFDMNARLSSRDRKLKIGRRFLQLLARMNGPVRVPYDYREIERFKIELELRRSDSLILSRFKVM